MLFRAALITFADSARLHFSFEEFEASTNVRSLVMAVPFLGGSSRTAKAFDLATELINEAQGYRGGRAIVYFITNDVSQVPLVSHRLPSSFQDLPEVVETAVDRLRRTNAEVNAISIGSQVSQPELRAIVSSPPSQHIYAVDSVVNLDAPFAFSVVQALCSVPPTTTTTTTQPTTTTFSCSSIDFIFVIDSASTMTLREWQLHRQFFADFVNTLPTDSRFVLLLFLFLILTS
jgi:hypothetical protein